MAENNAEFMPKFMIWFRNGCTSNTMERATDIFQDYSPEEQEELKEEYRQILVRLSSSSEVTKFIQD